MSARYPLPSNESERLAALDRLRIVGTKRTPDFDAILALALQVSGCRAGLIGLMEGDRHWFKAESGIGRTELPRDISLGNYTLLQREPLIVEDLAADTRFRDSPLVQEKGVRFYAGVALSVEGNAHVGTLCLADRYAHAPVAGLADALRDLRLIIEYLLETHRQAAQAATLAQTAEARERDLWNKTRLITQSERLAKVGAWELDCATMEFSTSDEASRIHEAAFDELVTVDDIRSRIAPDMRAHAKALMERCINTGQGYEYRAEFLTKRGASRWLHVVAEAERQGSEVVRVFGIVRDVTTEHQAERELWRIAHHDTLTNAPNRHYWTTRLDEAFARKTAADIGLTILMFDLDGFKEINDTRGHAVGDVVLRELASRLGQALPDTSFHARLGGDEFAVLLEGSTPELDVEIMVRHLLAAIKRPIVIDALRLQVSATFGSASYPADASNASDLMRKADIALYQAKRSNRSSFVSFRREIGDIFDDKRHAIDLVLAAIEQNRLVPFYQPKIDLKTGRPAGLEALCRIEAEDGTILGPSQFLPALQDPVSSARVGAAMLDLVTHDIAAWLSEGLAPGRIAINVTSSDFAQGDLDRRIFGRLGSLGLPADALEIEVTENTILGEGALVVGEALHAMREQGIIIALDDFGTGYASLTHLRDAPIHCIKLDRSFITGLGRNAESAIIVRSIVDLGHSLGMRVVAEGIELKGQADFLRAVGCDEAQGFLYGRPASRTATRALLQQAQRDDEVTRPRTPSNTGYVNYLSRRFGA